METEFKKKEVRKARNYESVLRSAKWHLFESSQAFFLTENELRQRLEKKTDVQEWIDKCIAEMKEYNYIKSDVVFCDDYIERAFFGDYGSNYIKNTLVKKGLSSELVDTRLTAFILGRGINENEILSNYINSYYLTFENTTKEKLVRVLSKRGFNHQQVSEAIRQHQDYRNLKTKMQLKAEKTDLETALLKLARKGKGLQLIKMELKSKLVDVSGIDEIVYRLVDNGELDFYDSCLSMLVKKSYDLADFKERSKAYGYLSQKGFSSEEIKYAIEQARAVA